MREKGEAKLYTINDIVIHKNKSNRMAYETVKLSMNLSLIKAKTIE